MDHNEIPQGPRGSVDLKLKVIETAMNIFQHRDRSPRNLSLKVEGSQPSVIRMVTIGFREIEQIRLISFDGPVVALEAPRGEFEDMVYLLENWASINLYLQFNPESCEVSYFNFFSDFEKV